MTTKNLARKLSRTLVVLSCLALLIAGSVYVSHPSRVRAQGPCTDLTGDGTNTGPVVNGPDRSRDLGMLMDDSCFRITEPAVPSSGAGVLVAEAEAQCGLGGDPYERWYKWTLTEPLCVTVEVTFSNSGSDVDVILFADFTVPNPNFRQNIKMFRSSLSTPGIMERIGPVLLPPGSYHVGISNFTASSPPTDITTIIRASASGPCQVFPARFEHLNNRIRDFDAVFCRMNDLDLGEITLANNLAIANRITPPSYPATLRAVQVLVRNRANQPVAGQPFQLLVYTDPSGAGTGPSGTPVVNETRNLGEAFGTTAIPILTTYQLTNPITIPSGDFYVGAFFQGAHNGRGPLFYTSIPDARVSFLSRNGITNWSGPFTLPDARGNPMIANAYVGGIINSGGTTGQGPDIEVTPTSLDFGNVTVNQNGDRMLMVRNTGTATLTVNSITSTNSQFSLATPTGPVTVVAGDQQTVTVRFRPTARRIEMGTLSIQSNALLQSAVAVSLVGQGR